MFHLQYQNQSAEAVGIGHPDKICDQISDLILDRYLTIDPDAKVACEVLAANRMIVIGGEISANGYVDVIQIAWEVLLKLGYKKNEIIIISNINQQSADINQAIIKNNNQLGSGDQGIVYGYACNETPEFLPLAFCLARELVQKATYLIANQQLPWAKYDMKSLVSLTKNDHGQPQISSVIFSIQHIHQVNNQEIQTSIQKLVFDPVFKEKYQLNDNYLKLINTSKRFVIGGIQADTGLTNRKLMVDSYGSISRHGGGGYSGKDPTKVDRTGAYLARWIAKNLVAAKICFVAEVRLVYALGLGEPINIDLDLVLTSQFQHLKKKEIIAAIKAVFPLSLGEVIEVLNLTKTKFFPLATHGHYGRQEQNLPWEATNKVNQLLQLLK